MIRVISLLLLSSIDPNYVEWTISIFPNELTNLDVVKLNYGSVSTPLFIFYYVLECFWPWSVILLELVISVINVKSYALILWRLIVFFARYVFTPSLKARKTVLSRYYNLCSSNTVSSRACYKQKIYVYIYIVWCSCIVIINMNRTSTTNFGTLQVLTLTAVIKPYQPRDKT